MNLSLVLPDIASISFTFSLLLYIFTKNNYPFFNLSFTFKKDKVVS